MILQVKRTLMWAIIILFSVLLTTDRTYAQIGNGYWQFVDLQTETWDDISEGKRSFMTGGPGSATYNTETDLHDDMIYYRATGYYDEPPKKLMPDQIISLNYGISITDFKQPDWHWNPGTHISILETKPYKDSENIKWGKNYGVKMVSGIRDSEPKEGIAVIEPPDYRGSGKAYYKIRFHVGSSTAGVYYNYIYEWRKGQH